MHLEIEHCSAKAEFEVREGEHVSFVMTWRPSYLPPADAIDPDSAIEKTTRWWQDWADKCTYQGEWRDAVVRSLMTLKALTYAPSGGVAAAATTSLPEWIGGQRNWDYRYCWLRDATFTLSALLRTGIRRGSQGVEPLAGPRRGRQGVRRPDHVRRRRRASAA